MTIPPKEEVDEAGPSTTFPPRPDLGTKPPPNEGLATAGIPAEYCSLDSNYTCYSAGVPSCCIFDTCNSQQQPPCEEIETYFVSTPVPPDEVPLPELFGELSPPKEGLRACNEVIPSAYPDNIIPREVVLAVLEGTIDSFGEAFASFKALLSAMAEYDVRAHKICTSGEEVLSLCEGDDASDVMPYCKPGSFASGRTFSALVLEPIDPATKAPIAGKVAATVWNWATRPDPFYAPTIVWPNDIATSPVEYLPVLSAATAGTYTIIPDVLGNAEDWPSTRSYVVKDVYSASAVPILLKLKNTIDGADGGCTEIDKRVSIVGYSEGGYAAVAVANAVDILNDGWVHTHTAVAGAPIKLATAQLEVIVDMSKDRYPFPAFIARLGNSYSSTNPDMATGAQQPFASLEYLDEDDPTKNLIEWARAGISYEEMFPLLPGPDTFGTQSDILNSDFVEMVVVSRFLLWIVSVSFELR